MVGKDDESDSVATSTNRQNQQQLPSTFLEMQTTQHGAEMEILAIQKSNRLSEHKRKLEVLDAEFEYWNSMKMVTKNTQENLPRPNTRSKK